MFLFPCPPSLPQVYGAVPLPTISLWLFIQCCLHHIAIGSRAQDQGCVDHYILIGIQTTEAQRYVIWVIGLVKEEGKKACSYYVFAPLYFPRVSYDIYILVYGRARAIIH